MAVQYLYKDPAAFFPSFWGDVVTSSRLAILQGLQSSIDFCRGDWFYFNIQQYSGPRGGPLDSLAPVCSGSSGNTPSNDLAGLQSWLTPLHSYL